MPGPVLVVVAGPNGSGKSTLTHALRADPVIGLPDLYINADDLQRAEGLDAQGAQRAATRLRTQAIAQRQDVMYETVMSHPARLAELQRAKAAGYDIAIHFVATDDPAINVERVALRVIAGGHDVPEDRTRDRYHRALALAPVAISFASAALIFDNTHRGNVGGLELQAQLVGQRLSFTVTDPAAWVRHLTAQVDERASDLDSIRMTTSSSLQAANLDGGHAEGPMLEVTRHYAVQRDRSTQVHVLHHRLLLPADQIMRGMNFRIAYREGVATVDPLS